MVNHSHSCGPVPVPLTPFCVRTIPGGGAIPPGMTTPPGPTGRVILKPLTRPIFDILPPAPIMPIPTDLAASLDPVEFVGESISMVSIALTPLLCLLCLFGAVAVVERGRVAAAAPGPGVSFGGAAAMGTTPFPPLIPVAPTEDPAEP